MYLFVVIVDVIVVVGGWFLFDCYMELVFYVFGLGYYSGGVVKFGCCVEDGGDFIIVFELILFFGCIVVY